MLGFGSCGQAVDALDGWLSGRDSVTGDRFIAADVYVGASVAWGPAFKSLPEHAAREYAARVTERPAAIRAAEIDNALMPRGAT